MRCTPLVDQPSAGLKSFEAFVSHGQVLGLALRNFFQAHLRMLGRVMLYQLEDQLPNALGRDQAELFGAKFNHEGR